MRICTALKRSNKLKLFDQIKDESRICEILDPNFKIIRGFSVSSLFNGSILIAGGYEKFRKGSNFEVKFIDVRN